MGLQLYASICGADLKECARLMDLLQLQKHATTVSGVLSGGNKVGFDTRRCDFFGADLDAFSASSLWQLRSSRTRKFYSWMNLQMVLILWQGDTSGGCFVKYGC